MRPRSPSTCKLRAIASYLFGQALLQFLLIYCNNGINNLGYVTFESVLGVYFCLQFLNKARQYRELKSQKDNLEEKSIEE